MDMKLPKPLPVILGSSRSDGDTFHLVQQAFAGAETEVIDLSTLDISVYDYTHANQGDDFLPLIERLIERPAWVLATPVYWYAMSAQMKIFFDRTRDLVTVRKDLGRRLAGKKVFVLSTGSSSTLPEGFEVPFRETCEYFDMRWGGLFYAPSSDKTGLAQDNILKAQNFAATCLIG